MNKIQLSFIQVGFAAAALIAGTTASAQTSLPEGSLPMIVTPHQQPVSYLERTICYDITANIPYEIASDQDWAVVRKGNDGILYVHLTQNYSPVERTAVITLSNAEKNVSQTITIVQERDNSAALIPTDPKATPSRTNVNTTQSGTASNALNATLDGEVSTFWHSQYAPSKFEVSESNPAILNYYFKNDAEVDYINYVPRQDQENGAFGKVEILMQEQGEEGLKSLGIFDWQETQTAKTVTFETTKHPYRIQFKVYSGYGGWATCAEMEFCKKEGIHADFDIFADDVYSSLKEGVTLGDIESLTNPFAKSLAMNLYAGNYSTDYRVATFPCKLSVRTLANSWKTPGKHYDQVEGVTGISFGPGKHAIIVSGLPAGKGATLKLVSWYNGIVGGSFDGGNPQERDFALTNGLNIINFNPAKDFDYLNKGQGGEFLSDYNALGYIEYNDAVDPSQYPDIKIHFVNGEVNGYLSPDKTNEEMHQITANAKNYCMDVLGDKVHSVWTSRGLHDYCKAIDGTVGYRQYMNVIDSLIWWEHEVLGLIKYNRVPDNRTFAYVNFTYYMFQGGRGVSFHADQESRVLNCNKLVNRDDDAIWGLSHEWGHQHQMHPYFCWKGMNEVTNNVKSYFNIMRMGYRSSDKINQWRPARKHFIDDNLDGVDVTSNARRTAYLNRGQLSWNADFYALATAMEDSVIVKQSENKLRSLGISEVGVGETLCPYIMLYAYFTGQKGMKDFYPDFYESLRQMEQEGGSTIEKSDGFDKYELVAMAQNNNTFNAIDLLAEKYPTSVWCRYITKDHCGGYDNGQPYILNLIRKMSRMTGYNLVPYFERWGFLRTIANYIGDYGDGWLVFPKAAYDEFIADMDALVADGTLKVMPEGMVEEISNAPDFFQSTPSFNN